MNRAKRPIARFLNIPFNPWFYFCLFTFGNMLLSYAGLSQGEKHLVGLLLLALPWTLAFLTYRPGPSFEHLEKKEISNFKFPLWGWTILGALALFIRFYRLDSLSVWPHYDEGVMGYYALKVMRNGFDRFFYFWSQITFVFIGWLALLFKWFGSSPFVMWLCPALLSIGIVPLTYVAARQYFSKPLALFCALAAAFSFWPLFAARFSEQVGFTPLIEAWVFLWLGRLLRSTTGGPDRLKMAVLLGTGLSLGFCVNFYECAAVTPVVLIALLFSKIRVDRGVITAFTVSFLATFLPIGILAAHQGIPAYIHNQWTGEIGDSSPKMVLAKAYVDSLFWGAPADIYSNYKPYLGGLLNPFLGALFFLGALEVLKRFTIPFHQWLVAAFLIFLLPGLLTSNLDLFRIFPLFAVIVSVMALGWSLLAARLPMRRWILAMLIFFAASSGLDLYHLFGAYHHFWDLPENWIHSVKSINNYRAYGLLKAKADTEGPGWILINLTAGIGDPTLKVAVDDFNAVTDPRLDPSKAKWAALLTNVNYQPFVSKALGPGKKYWLSKDLGSPDGGSILILVPVDGSNGPTLQKWIAADRSLENFNDQYFQYSGSQNGNIKMVMPSLEKVYGAFQKDPFLEACFWEKMSDLALKTGRPNQAAEYLKNAVHLGLPAAHLYYRLGALQEALQKKGEAKRSFQAATQAPLDFTVSGQLLATQFK